MEKSWEIPPDGFKLHIGCGKRILKGYINIDPYESVAQLKVDAAETGFPPDSVGEILCIHVIEHIEHDHFMKTLIHWKEILKPEGVVKLRCPNAVVYVREWLAAYEKGAHGYLDEWGRINMLGHSKHAGTLNRQLLTPELLRMKLEAAGFLNNNIEVGETRPEQRHTFEYRPDGDIICEARLS